MRTAPAPWRPCMPGRHTRQVRGERGQLSYRPGLVGTGAPLGQLIEADPPRYVCCPEPPALSGMSPRLAVIAAVIATVLLIGGGIVATSPGALPFAMCG